jgi:hypothetical protein
MATGIVNPHSVSPAKNTDYRDHCLMRGAIGLWMLDEPYGNDVATNQGVLGSAADGFYYGTRLTNAASRGTNTVFNIPAVGYGSMSGAAVVLPAGAGIINSSHGSSGRTTYSGVVRMDTLSREQRFFHQQSAFWVQSELTSGDWESEVRVNSPSPFVTSHHQKFVPYGQDYHYVFVYDAGFTQHFVNGVSVGTSNKYWVKNTNYGTSNQVPFTGFTGYDYPLYLGNTSASGSSKYVHGCMAGFAVFGYKFSATQVAALYNTLLT